VVVKLSYQDERHWRKDVLVNELDREMEGLVITYDGSTHAQYIPNTFDPRTGEQQVITDEFPTGVVVPDRWLHPNFINLLRQKGFAEVTSVLPNRVTFSKTSTLDCAMFEGPIHAPLPNVPDQCDTAATFQETETYTFRTDVVPPIPVSATIAQGGTVTWSAEVLEVDMSPPSLDLAPTPATAP
jgi:hypothetical protein